MAHDGEKKRNKRHAGTSIAPLKVQLVRNKDGPVPVIAYVPGQELPPTVPFTAYTAPRAQTPATAALFSQTNPAVRSSELLLHSSAHPQLDFTGREAQTGPEALWNHYAAVYDPAKGTLQLLEARQMN
ncbi:DNA-directed RNA polymerase I subunit rpa49, partial [Ascosphaera acerosa]